MLVWCLLVAVSTAWAQSIDLYPMQDGEYVSGRMHVLKETPGEPLNLGEALARDGWKPGSSENLRSILTRSTLWLTVVAENRGPQAIRRWISVGYWRLSDVQMFLVDPVSGALMQHMSDGLKRRFQHAAQRAPGAKAVFPIALEAGQRIRMVLRIHSGGWRSIDVGVWEPRRYTASVYSSYIVHGALGGFACALVMLLLISRNPLNGLLAIWLLLTLTFGAAILGDFAPHLPDWFNEARQAGFIASLSIWNSALLMLVTAKFLGMSRRQPWRYVLPGLMAIAAAATFSFAVLDGLWIRRSISSLLFGILLLWPLLVAHAGRRGRYGDFLVALLLALSWTLMLIRLISYVTGALVQYEVWLYEVMVHAQVVLLLGIVVQTLIRQRERELRNSAWIKQAGRRQRERLAALVGERTSQLESSMLAAQEANKAKTEFLGYVSHDLRSPLATIVGYAQLLQAEGGTVAPKATIIRRSAEHSLNVINDLVVYARDAGSVHADPQPTYTYWLLSVTAQQAQTLMQANENEFRLDIPDGLPPVIVADAGRLRRILINLLDNAAKFTHRGQVVLSVRCRKGEDAGAVEMTFEVSDTGQGMERDELERVFEPFYRGRGSASVEGMGLGMRIVAMWVERMNGSLVLHSQPSEGTRVAFTLPLTTGREEDIALPDTEWAFPVDIDGAGRHIWVVDDVPAIRQLLAERLRRQGFVVQVCSDGTDFIEKLRAWDGKRPDAVVTDYFMPGANGDAVLQVARQHWPGVPVILLSSMEATLLREQPAQMGAFDACLSKPVEFAMLCKLLLDLIDGDATARSKKTRVMQGRPVQSPEAAAAQPARSAEGSATLPSMHGAVPSRQQLNELAVLASLGALSDIEGWAAAVLRQKPECEAFVRRVLQLTRDLQMDAVCELAGKTRSVA